MIIALVLRSGGEFTSDHVRWLVQQLPLDQRIVCFSDIKIDGVEIIPLEYNWPGWWSKMELFNPDGICGNEDIFYLDLDTVVVGDISDFCSQKMFVALQDTFEITRKSKSFGAGLMYIPASIKKKVWDKWIKNPELHIKECTTAEKWGDQGFLSSVLEADKWQKILPNYVVGYKSDVMRKFSVMEKIKLRIEIIIRKVRRKSLKSRHKDFLRFRGDGNVPKEAKIIYFHGKPRPWEIDEPWIPPFERKCER